MYDLESMITGIKSPELAYFELLKVINRRRATTIVEEDWDNLIILDACRYDLFEEANFIPGELTPVRSLGSKTGEFLKENFGGSQFPDTVYISANPQVQLHNIDQLFYDRIRLWENEWDNEKRTIPPTAVANRSLQTERAYPNKRLIIHFVQPHYPFIGEKGEKIKHGEMIGDGLIAEKKFSYNLGKIRE